MTTTTEAETLAIVRAWLLANGRTESELATAQGVEWYASEAVDLLIDSCGEDGVYDLMYEDDDRGDPTTRALLTLTGTI
jgi:hypothetical protein